MRNKKHLMTKNTKQHSLVLAGTCIISTLSYVNIWMWPIRSYELAGRYILTAENLTSDILRFLFLILPFIALFAVFLNKKWALYLIIVYGIIAWILGASAIPFVAELFEPVNPRSIAITVCVLITIIYSIWLLRKEK